MNKTKHMHVIAAVVIDAHYGRRGHHAIPYTHTLQDVLRTSVLVLMATMGLMVWINTLDTVFFKLSAWVAAYKAGGG